MGNTEDTLSPDKASPSKKKRQKRKSAEAVLQAKETALDKGTELPEPASSMETDASTKKKKKKRRLTSDNGEKAANGSNDSTPMKKVKSVKAPAGDIEAEIGEIFMSFCLLFPILLCVSECLKLHRGSTPCSEFQYRLGDAMNRYESLPLRCIAPRNFKHSLKELIY